MDEIVTDLFSIERYLKPKGVPMDERAGVVKYFADTFKKDGKVLAIRLSYIKEIWDLYALKSQVEDRIERNGLVAARKYFYWRTETHRTPEARIALKTNK